MQLCFEPSCGELMENKVLELNSQSRSSEMVPRVAGASSHAWFCMAPQKPARAAALGKPKGTSTDLGRGLNFG